MLSKNRRGKRKYFLEAKDHEIKRPSEFAARGSSLRTATCTDHRVDRARPGEPGRSDKLGITLDENVFKQCIYFVPRQ